MKTYQLGVNRTLEVDDEKVLIKDTVSSAEAVLPLYRWSQFHSYVDQIDDEVKRINDGSDFRYRQHVGGGWYVSVTGGIRCVDFRRFFLNDKGDVKPTRHGIGLRLHEWGTLKDIIINRLPNDLPRLMKAKPCFHADFSKWLDCPECLPFINQSRSSSTTL